MDGFPPDILVVNLLAAFLLGLVTALHSRQVLSDDVNMLLGAGIMGGMSTFSRFVYGSVVLMHSYRAGPGLRPCWRRMADLEVGGGAARLGVAPHPLARRCRVGRAGDSGRRRLY